MPTLGNSTPELPIGSSDMLSRFQRSLSAFAASRDTFQVIHTLSSSSSSSTTNHNSTPPNASSSSKSPSLSHRHHHPRTLHILDSSFNPPTLAHRYLALQSLKLDSSAPRGESRNTDGSSQRATLLLLLATQNADKPPAPAGFPDRLAMMELLGKDIVYECSQDRGLDVIIAVTKHAKFVDKAAAIAAFYEQSKVGGGPDDGKGIDREAEDIDRLSNPDQPEQIWLTGYDTLERILAPKYYKPGNLSALEPFFEKCMVRVMARVGFGAEDNVIEKLKSGELERVGARKEWHDRIQVLEGLNEDVSSTNVRKAAKEGREEDVVRLVGPQISSWVAAQNLYR